MPEMAGKKNWKLGISLSNLCRLARKNAIKSSSLSVGVLPCLFGREAPVRGKRKTECGRVPRGSAKSNDDVIFLGIFWQSERNTIKTDFNELKLATRT